MLANFFFQQELKFVLYLVVTPLNFSQINPDSNSKNENHSILMTVTHWDFARFAWEPGTLTLHMNVYTVYIDIFLNHVSYFNIS